MFTLHPLAMQHIPHYTCLPGNIYHTTHACQATCTTLHTLARQHVLLHYTCLPGNIYRTTHACQATCTTLHPFTSNTYHTTLACQAATRITTLHPPARQHVQHVPARQRRYRQWPAEGVSAPTVYYCLMSAIHCVLLFNVCHPLCTIV